MAPPVWPFTVVFTTWIALLVGTSLLLVWLTARYPREVFHRAGVRELAAAIGLLTAGAVIEGTFWSGLTASPWALVVARALMAACGVALTAAGWNFAAPFLGPEGEAGPDDTWFEAVDDD